MNSINAALLVNLIGFTVGIALYALLPAMVVRHRKTSTPGGVNILLLITGFLGLLWNLGELFVFVQKDFGAVGTWPFATAIAYSALGFLPSVVVHSAQSDGGKASLLTYAAYCLSAFAAVLHFQAASVGQTVPSDLALQSLTFGSLGLAAGLLLFNFRQTLEKKTVWAAALLIFAVSSLHLSGDRTENSWVIELAAHQSSLPLAIAILLQNYRFAFADLFLKRAISLMLLALAAFGLYIFVAAPLLRYHETHDRNDALAVSLIITLWITTALIYPTIHRFAVLLVDKVILHRSDYSMLQQELARKIDANDSIEGVLDMFGEKLADELTAKKFGWTSSYDRGFEFAEFVNFGPDNAKVFIPTSEQPYFRVDLSDFQGGRRLLSDEISMLGAVALLAARRIDSLRVTHERCEQEFREQEFSKLATEAQLTALRAQINPHFLFNALTTIGYLIQAAPDKAFQTLLELTKLLRGVLNTTAEFWTLDEELKLIQSYLDIERARFEERLNVTINVPRDLRRIQIPSLILQPLVENAIKHGISENKNGGEVGITAESIQTAVGASIKLIVSDTGSNRPERGLQSRNGVGLQNIRERLDSHYGQEAGLSVEVNTESGTKAIIELPAKSKIAETAFKR